MLDLKMLRVITQACREVICQRDRWMAYVAKCFVCCTVLLAACSQAQDTRSVTLSGYNYTDRPIYYYSVNDVMGSNLFIDSDGAKMSCCAKVTVGKPAVIEWMYSYSKKQYEAGMREEEHSTTAIVPTPQTPEAHYLEVHFYPDGHVELALVNFPTKHRRIPYVEKDE